MTYFRLQFFFRFCITMHYPVLIHVNVGESSVSFNVKHRKEFYLLAMHVTDFGEVWKPSCMKYVSTLLPCVVLINQSQRLYYLVLPWLTNHSDCTILWCPDQPITATLLSSVVLINHSQRVYYLALSLLTNHSDFTILYCLDEPITATVHKGTLRPFLHDT